MLTWHCKGREEPSMVFSRDRRIISVPKSSWEGSTKKEYIRRFLAATKMMKYFMQASYNITGQKSGANIWITLEQSIFRTKLLQNNWNDTPRCIIFGTIHNKWRKASMRSHPDYHETTRAMLSMNREACQNTKSMRRNNYREDPDPEKLHWLFFWLSHNWKWHFAVNRNSNSNSTQRHHQEWEEEHASGNRDAFTHSYDDWWKAKWWTKSWWERSRWTRHDEVWSVFFL